MKLSSVLHRDFLKFAAAGAIVATMASVKFNQHGNAFPSVPSYGAAADGSVLPAAPSAPYLVFGSQTSVPHGHVAFCARLLAECGFTGNAPVQLILNDSSFAIVSRINRDANHAIRSVEDKDQHGIAEQWSSADETARSAMGDCEDYVLYKRRALQNAFPQVSMSIVKVDDHEGGPHAVLAVHTNLGDLILDNKNDAVLYAPQTGYKYIKATSFTNSAAWQGVASPRFEQPRFTASAP